MIENLLDGAGNSFEIEYARIFECVENGTEGVDLLLKRGGGGGGDELGRRDKICRRGDESRAWIRGSCSGREQFLEVSRLS